MTRSVFYLSWGFVFLVASVAVAQKQVAKPTPAAHGFTVGEGRSHANLTVFPILSPTPKSEDRFTTLDEGLVSGTVEIREVGAAAPANLQRRQQIEDPFGEDDSDGNDVNRLIVTNKSKKPLYLMPGEILLGGDQDRTVGEELVISPDGKPHEVKVFCVEHGRWGRRGAAELRGYIDVAGASASISRSGDVVQEANSGKFIGSVGSLSKKGRIAVQGSKNQGKVWDEVAEENEKAGVKSMSGSFTGNYAEADVVKRLKPYQDELAKPIAETRNVVGVIVAINGKPESLDVFESTPLFKKLWPKLLKSYALDAANANGDKKVTACTQSDATDFLTEVAATRTKEEVDRKDVSASIGENDKALLFTARPGQPGAARASSASGLGGFGGAIHGAGFAK